MCDEEIKVHVSGVTIYKAVRNYLLNNKEFEVKIINYLNSALEKGALDRIVERAIDRYVYNELEKYVDICVNNKFNNISNTKEQKDVGFYMEFIQKTCKDAIDRQMLSFMSSFYKGGSK